MTLSGRGGRVWNNLAPGASSQTWMDAGLLMVPDLAYLKALWASPEFRRRGIGELPIADVLSWARETSAEIVRLVVV